MFQLWNSGNLWWACPTMFWSFIDLWCLIAVLLSFSVSDHNKNFNMVKEVLSRFTVTFFTLLTFSCIWGLGTSSNPPPHPLLKIWESSLCPCQGTLRSKQTYLWESQPARWLRYGTTLLLFSSSGVWNPAQCIPLLSSGSKYQPGKSRFKTFPSFIPQRRR